MGSIARGATRGGGKGAGPTATISLKLWLSDGFGRTCGHEHRYTCRRMQDRALEIRATPAVLPSSSMSAVPMQEGVFCSDHSINHRTPQHAPPSHAFPRPIRHPSKRFIMGPGPLLGLVKCLTSAAAGVCEQQNPRTRHALRLRMAEDGKGAGVAGPAASTLARTRHSLAVVRGRAASRTHRRDPALLRLRHVTLPS